MINMIGIHFLAMLTVAAAELTPGYRATQRRVAWIVMLALISLGSGVMWMYKVDLGLAVFLCASALFASASNSTGLQTRIKPASTTEQLFGWLVFAAILAVIGWAFQSPLEVDYLLAQPPWWGVVLLALLATFLATKWNGTLSSACRDRVASGNDPILSLFDMQEVSAKLMAQRLGDQVEPYERITNRMIGVGLILFLIVLAIQYAPAFWFTPVIDGILRTYLPTFAGMGVFLILMKWWSRVPFFATMITRPPSRTSQINQIFVGVAADFARAVPLLLAVAFLMGSRVVDKFGSVAEVCFVTFLLTAGVVGVLYALTLAALTVRSTRWIVVTCFLAVVTFSLFGGLVAYIALEGKLWILESDTLFTFSALSVAAMAVATGATILIWRRYQNIEWGSFLS